MHKIGILYICTGKYDIFWEEFYKSCEEYFLTDCEKHYYVFTDAPFIYEEENNQRIHKIYQENLGWPNNTLKRFHVFWDNKEHFSECDYLFFMNANLLVKDKITIEEFLPIEENLLAVKHPGFFDKDNSEFTYDRNESSTAYIPMGKGNCYVAGGLNGGKTSAFLEAIETLKNNVDQDETKNIIALWHDESHFNKFIFDRSDVKILNPGYLYPEGWNLPFSCKILIRDKSKYGGHSNMRGLTENKETLIFKKIKSKIKKIILK